MRNLNAKRGVRNLNTNTNINAYSYLTSVLPWGECPPLFDLSSFLTICSSKSSPGYLLKLEQLKQRKACIWTTQTITKSLNLDEVDGG